MLALAGGELIGDKMKTAPDRIVPAGMVARVATGMIAGAALAPRRQRGLAALIGAGVAVVGAGGVSFFTSTFGASLSPLSCHCSIRIAQRSWSHQRPPTFR